MTKIFQINEQIGLIQYEDLILKSEMDFCSIVSYTNIYGKEKIGIMIMDIHRN
jgi:hypothetical protein